MTNKKQNQQFNDAWKYAGWVNKAIDGYQYAFEKYLDTFPILEYGDFWQMQHKLANDIIGYGLPFPLASAHIFSGPTDDEDINYTFQDALRFVKSWKDMSFKTSNLLAANCLPVDFADSILLTDSDLWEELLNGTLATSEFELGTILDDFAEDTYENEYSAELLRSMRDTSGIGERLEGAARGAFAAKVRSSSSNKQNKKGTQTETESGLTEGSDTTNEFPEN